MGLHCPRGFRLAGLALLAITSAAMSGCGLFSQNYAQATPVPAQYTGLADKSVAIVVYTMPATIDEFSGSREEISAFIENQIRQFLPTTRLLDPREVIRWQNSTINWYGLSEMDIGKHFGVDRVLSVHVLEYSTRRLIGYSDLQGRLRAQCKVIETDQASSPRSPASWSGIVDVKWPQDRPLDATQVNQDAVRQRVLELFANRLVRHFYDHVEQPGGEGIRTR